MSALIKLLSGLQAGAEFSLQPGSYTIGSGDDADVVLMDAAMRPLHARLEILSDAWSVEPLEGAEIQVDGSPVSSATSLVAYQVVGLGGTHLAIGPDGPWEKLPGIPAPKAEPVAALPEVQAPAEESAQSTGAEQRRPDDEHAGARRPEPQSGQASAETPAVSAAWMRHPGRLLAGAAILLACVLGFLYLTRGGDKGQKTVTALAEQGIRAVYPAPDDSGALAPGTVGVALSPDGVLSLTGLVMSGREMEAARRAVASVDENAAVSLRSATEMVAEADDAIAAEYPLVRLRLLPDSFNTRLSGIVLSPQKAESAYRLARERVDARLSISRRIWIWEDLRRDAEHESARQGVTDPRFALDENTVTFASAQRPTGRQLENTAISIEQQYDAAVAALIVRAMSGRDGETAPEDGQGRPQAETTHWTVVAVTGDGFIDQYGTLHRNGDYLHRNLLLVKSWSGGVTLQRGSETIFRQIGTVITCE